MCRLINFCHGNFFLVKLTYLTVENKFHPISNVCTRLHLVWRGGKFVIRVWGRSEIASSNVQGYPSSSPTPRQVIQTEPPLPFAIEIRFASFALPSLPPFKSFLRPPPTSTSYLPLQISPSPFLLFLSVKTLFPLIS